MNKFILKLCFLCLLLSTSLIQAQRNGICMSEELSSNSEMMKVKMGTKWFNKMWDFKFGDYNIVSSKTGWTTTTEKSNLLNTRTEGKSEYKFSFLLNDKTADTAIVNALNKTSIKELHSFELFSNVFIGDDELLEQTDFFTSFITLTSNKNETWELLIEDTYSKESGFKYDAFLTYNDRIITINPVSSKDCNEDKRWFPALGYEFIENGKSLCAVQYFGGGTFGNNKNRVWLKADLQPNMKLVLAAAMTALLEVRGPDYIEQLYFNGND